MAREKHPTWEELKDEYLELSTSYVDLIERSLTGENIDITSELGELFFWRFGIVPQYEDLSVASHFYKDANIPPLSRWKNSGGAKAFKEWKETWIKSVNEKSPEKASYKDYLSIRKGILRAMIDVGCPMHYRSIFWTGIHDYSGNRLGPVTINAHCTYLEKKGELVEVAPGIWSRASLQSSTPASLSEVEFKIADRILPPERRPVYLYDELQSKWLKGRYTSHIEMEEDVKRIFEYLGFDAERKGKPGETDVVAQDGKNVLIIECKAWEKFPLAKLSTVARRHIEKVRQENPSSAKNALYLIVSNGFSPSSKTYGTRHFESHKKYVADAEKAIGIPVIPMGFSACYELMPLSIERRFFPDDVVSIITQIFRERKTSIWWSHVRDQREAYGKRLSLSCLLEDLFPVIRDNPGKLDKEEVVNEILNTYHYSGRLTPKEVPEARPDLEELIHILDYLDFIYEDSEGHLVIRSVSYPFVLRRLEEFLFGRTWKIEDDKA